MAILSWPAAYDPVVGSAVGNMEAQDGSATSGLRGDGSWFFGADMEPAALLLAGYRRFVHCFGPRITTHTRVASEASSGIGRSSGDPVAGVRDDSAACLRRSKRHTD